MNSAHALTAENLLRALPEVLRNDESMAALAASVAQVLAQRPEEIQRLAIYPRIDELPEDLLDILAYDFKVDWYDYNYSLETKRAIIKGSFFVHRKMGTKRSVETALSAIYPGTYVEEWFEYGGDPYYFRVILDVTSPREDIDNEKLIRALDLYKPLRAHLDGTAVIYRSRVELIVSTAWGYVLYSARRCGTWPQAATRGGVARELVIVETGDGQAAYTAPATGEAVTGTWPQTATRGGVARELVVVETADGQAAYIAPAAGKAVTGTHPQAAAQGGQAGALVVVEGVDGQAVYTAPAAGEDATGTHPQAAARGGQAGAVVAVVGLDGQTVYAAPAAGIHPQTAARGGAAEGGLTFTEAAGSAGVSARPCGSPPGAL